MAKDPSKLPLGFALVMLGLLIVFGQLTKKPPQIADSFANEPVIVSGFTDDSEDGEIPFRIIIPQINIDLTVKKAEIIDGYWEVFPDTAAWGSGSGLPGKAGNQVIFAHAREPLFLPLKYIKKDMDIYILTKEKWYTYKVMEIKEVLPTQIETIAPTEDETLTLYTCSGFADSKRLIVVAKRNI